MKTINILLFTLIVCSLVLVGCSHQNEQAPPITNNEEINPLHSSAEYLILTEEMLSNIEKIPNLKIEIIHVDTTDSPNHESNILYFKCKYDKNGSEEIINKSFEINYDTFLELYKVKNAFDLCKSRSEAEELPTQTWACIYNIVSGEKK